MTVIDTHTHIYLEEFGDDRVELIQRAEKEGVAKILMPAIDSESHGLLFKAEQDSPGICYSMMGLHPCSVKEQFRDELAIVHGWLKKRPFAGIGEIGLDYYWDKTFEKEQKEALREQLTWALDFNLPFSLHSRLATDDCIEIVAEFQQGQLNGVFHCFSGNELQARKIIELGCYLGIGGVVTYKNSGLDQVLKIVGLDHLVLETDAPYLTPVPFRGKRNEPSYLKFVVKKLSEIFDKSEEEVIRITTANAEKIFPIVREI